MKKKFLIVAAVCLLLPAMLFAENTTKMLTSFFPNYNISKTTGGEYQFSLSNFGMGCNYATVFTNDNGDGWGFNTKLDVGLDFKADRCVTLAVTLNGAYYSTINKNTGVMFSFGPAWAIVEENKNASTDCGFAALGFDADVSAYLMPSPNFGFVFGSTLYAMPLILDYTKSTKQATPFFSVSSYVGFTFAFDSGTSDGIFIPHYLLY
jgi:hypothetical protein